MYNDKNCNDEKSEQVFFIFPMNFSALYLNYLKTKICTEEDLEIKTISINKEMCGYSFISPSIKIDILKENESKPIIKIIEPLSNIEFLQEHDIYLYSVEINKKEKWARNQKKRYYLRHISALPNPNSEKINKLPLNHYIEMDIANKKIRLVGNNISPSTNKTNWIYF